MRPMIRGLLFSLVVAGMAGCAASPDAPQAGPVHRATSALSGPLQNDFEDGTTQGWFPFGSPTVANSTDVANTGTHSLLTTNRTATFMGPGTSLTGQLTAGASYKVSVAARLAAGSSPTTLSVTVMRTLSDGTNQFDSAVSATTVTADGWTTLTGTYSVSTSNVTGLILYVESASATASYYIDSFSLTQSAPAPIAYDFEDGTTQGWFPFGSPTVANSTDVGFTGTHSLLTTNRTASFMGPGVNLQGQLTKGATYQVTVSVRMQAGQPASTLLATVARTPTGGSTAFDSVATAANVTDQAWMTVTGLYTFSTDNSSLVLYVQTQSGNASYYVDAVSVALIAPPPGAPGNTAGASSTFESQTAEGWHARTGGETVAVTNADAHGGAYSLLTSNRTATFQGPAFDVTNVMFNGSQYVVSLWAKLAPGEADTQLRVSLDRKAGSIETFHTIVGNTTVTAGGWVRLQATYSQALANSSLTLYVESASGTSSFYIDDFSITYVTPAIAERNIPSVHQSVAQVFPIIGAAVIPADIQQAEPSFLLSKHFNSITSGNDMKWDTTEPTEGNFDFAQADAEVAFAKANDMHVRGHTLVWHNQVPAWVFNDASGNPMTPTADNRALLIQRMQSHITAEVTHFGSDVPVWDAVNEPIDPSQADGYRRSPWFDIIGPEYIAIALQAARAASPTAKLYINDFDTTNPVKRDFLVALVRGLKTAGVPLDGIGHQMHDNIEYPSTQSVLDAVNLFDTTGVEQAITELDVSIYSGSFPTPFTSYPDIPQSRHVQVGYSYLGFVQALKQVSSKIASITIWGTSDDKSWLTSSTKVDAPLLFDPSLQKKPAYWAFVDPTQLPGADLSTSVSAPATVAVGQTILYTITVTNNRDSNQQSYDPTDDDLPAANVSLSTAVPNHTVFGALTAPAGWACTTPSAGASGPVICTVPSLAAGASATLTLTVAITDCATPNGASIVAAANVTSTTADPNPASNNAASAAAQASNTPPRITASGALTTAVECATPYVDPGASASDSCQGPVPVFTSSTVNTKQAGSYAVTYSAVDQAGGQAAPVVRTVNVVDTTPPVVAVAGANPARVECATTFVDSGATAADGCAGALPVAATGTVNASVPGSYTLSYGATDPSGNMGTASRQVNVSDTTAPAMDTIDLTILAQGLKIVLDDGTLTIAGKQYPLNRSAQLTVAGHTITISGGAITVDGFPALAGARTIVLLPPNHDYHNFTIADLVSSVTDTCSATLGLQAAVITKISSDEAQNAAGTGNTQNDVVIAADCRSAQLRIERRTGGNGRVYDIALHVQDPSGNRTAATVQVMVPPSGLGAVDDGAAYTVNSACP